MLTHFLLHLFDPGYPFFHRWMSGKEIHERRTGDCRDDEKGIHSRLSQNSNQFYNWIMSNVDFKFRS
jgi:hypothetical protein